MMESNTFYFSNIPNLWSMAWLYFTDAATVKTVTPVTSQSWIGKTVKLTCTAEGAPIPALSWKNPDGKVLKKVTELNNIVDVQMTSDQDFGNYTCEATNDVKTDTSTVLVQQISKWNISCSLVVYKNLWYKYKREKKNILSFCRFGGGCICYFFNLRKPQGTWVLCSLTFTWDKNTLSIITSSERLNSHLSRTYFVVHALARCFCTM